MKGTVAITRQLIEGKLNVDVLRAEDGLRARECPSGHHIYR